MSEHTIHQQPDHSCQAYLKGGLSCRRPGARLEPASGNYYCDLHFGKTLGSAVRIPIITLHQPWATWIALGWKSIETRLHPRFAKLNGQRIGIHAGARWDQDAFDTAEQFLSDEQLLQTKDYFRLRMAIVCTAMVSDFRKLTVADGQRALIECRTNRFGLVLEDVHVPIVPQPVQGQRGIWYHPIEGPWTPIEKAA